MRTRSAPYVLALALAVVVLLTGILLAAPARGLRAELFGGLVFVLLAYAAHAGSLREALAPTQPSG